MVIAKIRVNGTIARTVYRKAIPAGIIGAQVEFDYADDIWHGLRKTVVFKGAVTKDVVTDANIVTIPHEVVEKPSFRLNIGVYGVDADGNVAIPTLWEDIGAILDAADPSGDTNTDPSLPVWAQIQEQIGNLDELTTEAKGNLVVAINEVEQSGGGKSVQHDWNQNDDTQPDYVKNRPFYTGDPVETALVEETTVPFVDENGLYSTEFPSTFEAIVGETYKVSWDGAAYECTCVALGKELALGNLSILGAGSDTGEPFVMGIFNGQGIVVLTADTSASHTFSISKTVVPVVKIDKKYLVQPDWNQNDENAADFVKNRPFYANSLVSVRNPKFPEAFWYKVSDAVPTGEHSVGAPCSLVINRGKTNREIILSTDDYYAATEAFVFVALKDNVKAEGITFPEKGTYFAYVSGKLIVTGFALGADADSEITWDGRTEKEIKKIDTKYLPDNLATKSDVEAAQTTANAAQTTANAAQTTANAAQTTANAAQTAAAGSVSFTSSQNLTDAQKKRARTNIGAGTSNFSGSYDDLTHKPAAVQSDWNVNKNSDAAYIKNRTHYDYTAYRRVTFSNSPTASSLINDTHYYGEATGSSLTLDTGSIYKVSCDNATIYESTCKTLPLQGQPLAHTCKVLGNVQLGVDAGYLDITSPYFPVTDVDTGEPWCFMSYNYTAKNAIISTIPNFRIDGISVQTAHELKQLDEKYIPSTIQRVGDDLILSSSTEGSTKKFKITVDDSGALTATEVV